MMPSCLLDERIKVAVPTAGITTMKNHILDGAIASVDIGTDVITAGNIAAGGVTTSEILEALRLARLPLRGMTSTAEFFGACDMVKFARHAPPAEETRATVERAYRLIDETRAPEQPAEAPAGVAAGGGR